MKTLFPRFPCKVSSLVCQAGKRIPAGKLITPNCWPGPSVLLISGERPRQAALLPRQSVLRPKERRLAVVVVVGAAAVVVAAAEKH